MKRKSIILLITLGSRRRHRIFQEGRRETAFPFRRISRKLAGVADESNFVVAPVGKSSPFHFFFFFANTRKQLDVAKFKHIRARSRRFISLGRCRGFLFFSLASLHPPGETRKYLIATATHMLRMLSRMRIPGYTSHISSVSLCYHRRCRRLA